MNPFYLIEETVQVVKFDLKSTVGEENKALAVGQTVEVRGVVNSNESLSFEDMTQSEVTFELCHVFKLRDSLELTTPLTSPKTPKPLEQKYNQKIIHGSCSRKTGSSLC